MQVISALVEYDTSLFLTDFAASPHAPSRFHVLRQSLRSLLAYLSLMQSAFGATHFSFSLALSNGNTLTPVLPQSPLESLEIDQAFCRLQQLDPVEFCGSSVGIEQCTNFFSQSPQSSILIFPATQLFLQNEAVMALLQRKNVHVVRFNEGEKKESENIHAICLQRFNNPALSLGPLLLRLVLGQEIVRKRLITAPSSGR